MSLDAMEEYERKRAALAAQEQAGCPHLQGSNPFSTFTGPLAAIVWHTLNTGEEIGICANCQRKFLSTDEDFGKWRRMKCGMRASSAGVEKAVTPEEEEEILKNGYGNLPYDTDRSVNDGPSDQELLQDIQAAMRAIQVRSQPEATLSAEKVSTIREVLNVVALYVDTRPEGQLGSTQRDCAQTVYARIEALLTK